MLSVEPDGSRGFDIASTAGFFEPLFDQASKHTLTSHAGPKVRIVVSDRKSVV